MPNFTHAHADQRKANAYPGGCINCGAWIGPLEGLLTKKSDGSWGVEHVECPTTDSTDAPLVHPTASDFTPNYVNGKILFDGTYTLESVHGGHRTLRLKTQRLDAEFMPGAQLVQVLTGRDNTHDYTGVGHIKNGRLSMWKSHRDTVVHDDVKNFLANPSLAQAATTCFRCHRLLTTPESIATGMGAECAGKGL